MWTYIKEATKTHPFNFFTLLIAFLAAGFAGWSTWETHRIRVGADDAAADQKRSVERSLELAKEDAIAVKQMASVATAEQRQKLRSWLYVEGARWELHQSMPVSLIIDLLNKGGTAAESITGTCTEKDSAGNVNHLKDQDVSTDAISPSQHKNLFINATGSPNEGLVECSLQYNDVFEDPHSLHFVCSYNHAETTIGVYRVINP